MTVSSLSSSLDAKVCLCLLCLTAIDIGLKRSVDIMLQTGAEIIFSLISCAKYTLFRQLLLVTIQVVVTSEFTADSVCMLYLTTFF